MSQVYVCVSVMKRDDSVSDSAADSSNMTVQELQELRHDAPLATFDDDEWREVLDEEDELQEDRRQGAQGHQHSCPAHVDLYADDTSAECPRGSRESDGGFDKGVLSAGSSGSLEDLVNGFDDNVRQCFHNYSQDTDLIAPVQLRTHQQVLQQSQSVA